MTDFHKTHPAAGMIVEGETWLLAGQTSKFLLRQTAATTLDGDVQDTFKYLNAASRDHWSAESLDSIYGNKDLQLELLGHRARRLASECMRLPEDDGCKFRLMTAHIQYLALHVSYHKAHQQPILSDLIDLYFADVVETYLGEFLEDWYMTGDQASWIRQMKRDIMRKIRPELVGLVEAFDMDDFYLNSALGSSHGNVYEQILKSMLDEPLNIQGQGIDEHGVVMSYKDTIGKIIHGEVEKFKKQTLNISVYYTGLAQRDRNPNMFGGSC